MESQKAEKYQLKTVVTLRNGRTSKVSRPFESRENAMQWAADLQDTYQDLMQRNIIRGFNVTVKKNGGIKNMIKIETEKDGKINAAICGNPDEVIPEFFSLLNHITKNCMDNCKDGKQEEFAAVLKFEIDKTFMEAVKETIDKEREAWRNL